MHTDTFIVDNFTELKMQLLCWANRFSSCSFLDNQQYQLPWQKQECLVAAGASTQLVISPHTTLTHVEEFVSRHKGEWLFGHFSYDFKAIIEQTTPHHTTPAGFAVCSLFVPEVVIKLSVTSAVVYSSKKSPQNVWDEVVSQSLPVPVMGTGIDLYPAITREAYLRTVNQLKEHIHKGDCYEINFCQEFYNSNVLINPVAVYAALAAISPNPFSCFYRQQDAYLLCASPERFIARDGSRIYSQPIKGTATRAANSTLDEANIKSLLASKKERSENVMVVDLVRNDLSKICGEGSVQVDELFGIYTFPHVHQMVSTISGQLRKNVSFTDILAATFPMGSMTGAPKKRVMELIAAYESSNRGLFSGTVGYIEPNGNFDFNVVIRSLLYNAANRYLCCWVGSGITWYSQARDEYEECLLKAAAIKKVLQTAALS